MVYILEIVFQAFFQKTCGIYKNIKDKNGDENTREFKKKKY